MTISSIVLMSCYGAIILSAIYFGIFVYPYRDHTEETKKRPRSWVSNAYFRELWYFIMGPLKEKLIAWDIAPNTITWWGFAFSIAGSYLFALGDFGWGAFLTILSATCDVYDGQLARARNISLKSGSFLDSCLDRVSESVLFFGLMWCYRNEPLWYSLIFITFASSQLTSYARARAEGLGFPGNRGFFQRAERMIVLSIGMGAYSIVYQFSPEIAEPLPKITLGFLFAGSLQTGVARSIGIYREILATEN